MKFFLMRAVFFSGLLLLPASVLAQEEDVFASRSGGFSIRKPDGWVFLNQQAVRQNAAVPRLRDARSEARLRDGSHPPLVIMAKHQEPYHGLNPSAQVRVRTLRPGEEAHPSRLLNTIVSNLRQNFRDFEMVQEITPATLGGLPAAMMSARYTVADSKGKELRTWSRTWLAPRGEYLIILTLSGAQEGPDVAEKEFAAIVESMRIDPPAP